MEMTEGEIARNYRRAKDKDRQVGILAEPRRHHAHPGPRRDTNKSEETTETEAQRERERSGYGG